MNGRIARMLAAAAVVVGLASCAGVKEAREDVEAATPGLASTDEGIIESVEDQRVSVRSVENPDRVVEYERMSETDLTSGGEAIDWSELEEGDAIRVSYESAQGPERLLELEVLTGEEEERVKAEVEGAE